LDGGGASPPARERAQGSAPGRNGTSAGVATGPQEAILETEYQRPAGLSLLFCSRAEIDAAPAGEREAYFRIVESICANPGAYGFRYETAMDLAREDAADRAIHGANQDWS
jgi:hypothetical protein